MLATIKPDDEIRRTSNRPIVSCLAARSATQPDQATLGGCIPKTLRKTDLSAVAVWSNEDLNRQVSAQNFFLGVSPVIVV